MHQLSISFLKRVRFSCDPIIIIFCPDNNRFSDPGFNSVSPLTLEIATINIDIIKTFIVLMNPFMPHLAQELWELSGNESELTFNDWPNYDENQILSDKLKLAVQINGKRRSEIEVDLNMEEKDIKQFAKSDSKIIRYLEEKEILKEIYVRGRLVNLVVK